MEFAAVVRELEKSGSAQTRKTYARHGIGPYMYGVSYAKLGEMKKKIKVDQALAEKLWATGNHDCRELAAMILDPTQVKKSTLNAWAKESDSRCACSRLARAVAATPYAVELASKWCASKTERENWAGWTTIAELAVAAEPNDDLDEMFAACVPVIEKNLQSSPNYTRYVMNGALIAIGGRTPSLKKLALAAAKKIGHVEVDHGDTACKTPVATEYIAKIWARKKK
jgi:3-methyladenine DNA glycosylase AlkD